MTRGLFIRLADALCEIVAGGVEKVSAVGLMMPRPSVLGRRGFLSMGYVVDEMAPAFA